MASKITIESDKTYLIIKDTEVLKGIFKAYNSYPTPGLCCSMAIWWHSFDYKGITVTVGFQQELIGNKKVNTNEEWHASEKEWKVCYSDLLGNVSLNDMEKSGLLNEMNEIINNNYEELDLNATLEDNKWDFGRFVDNVSRCIQKKNQT